MNQNNWSYQNEIAVQDPMNDTVVKQEGVMASGEEKKPFELEGYTTLFDKAVVLTPVELTIR
jgi:hypothetical protein